MMAHNPYLLVFAAGFLGCVLATPVVTRLAAVLGAIDRPDHFRRIHKGATPRLGGLAVAFGLALAIGLAVRGGGLLMWPDVAAWWSDQWAVVLAALIVLGLGVLDDTRGVAPRSKLLGQTAAIMVLIAGGIRIESFSILGFPIDLTWPVTFWFGEQSITLDIPSMAVTLAWFLACMNIWNLIDGMDGLASGVGLLVSGTLMLVAMREGSSEESVLLAGALAGALAGFLLYNWHPACIFLGDSGSLLMGLLFGVIGVQSSMKGTTTVSILFPILAMGLPISDTAMAIFRRWVRELPMSAADRRHVHHLLIGLGLSPRQAALFLYCFSGFLCGVVLLGVSLNNQVHGEFFCLVVGGSGCLAFLLILTSRRDELASLVSDFRAKTLRKAQERTAAKITWDGVQKIELCSAPEGVMEVLEGIARELGCQGIRVRCSWGERLLVHRGKRGERGGARRSDSSAVVFRIRGRGGIRLVVAMEQLPGSSLPADITFRAVQRVAESAAGQMAWLTGEEEGAGLAEIDGSVTAEQGTAIDRGRLSEGTYGSIACVRNRPRSWWSQVRGHRRPVGVGCSSGHGD